METLEQSAEALTRKAMVALNRYFDGDREHTEKEIREAKVAVTVFATSAKLKQANSARDALNFAMARELAADKNQLQKYVRAAFPNSPLVPVLPALKA